MIIHYLKIAWRNLMKYKVQNAVSIIGLAVCLLCFAICLYISRLILSTDQCFEHKERIAEITLKSSDGDILGIPTETIDKLRALTWQEVEAFTYLAYPREHTFQIEVEPDEMSPFDPIVCMEVDTCFRQVFGLEIRAGSWQAATRMPNAVILSESVARRIYGDNLSEAIGKRLQRLSNSYRQRDVGYTVQAVMADIPLNNSFAYLDPIALLVLNDTAGRLQWKGEDVTGGMGYALLKEGRADRTQLEEDIHKRGIKQPLFDTEYDIHVSPLGHAYWTYGGTKWIVRITSVIGILVLLVGLLNFFYFQVGTFLNRSREYSLRRVFGGNGAHLLGQLFIQAGLTLLIAFLLVFVMIELLAPVLHIAIQDLKVTINPLLLQYQCAQYLLGVLACSFWVCLFTVMRTRRVSIQTGIRGTGVGGSKHRMRTLMLGVQYFVCWIFVTLAMALYLQADKTTSTLFGTLTRQEKGRIISLPLDYPFMQQADKLALVERIKRHAGVEDYLLADIAYTNGVSGNMLFSQPVSQSDKKEYNVDILSVPRNFFQFMHIPIVQGEVFGEKDGMVVDQRFAQELSEQDGVVPLGALFYDYGKAYKVTGVSTPFVANAYRVGTAPGYYKGCVFMFSDFRQYVGHCYVKCHEGKAEEVRRYISGLLRETLPATIEPRISTFLKDIELEQGIENALKGIILFLAVVCVVITLLGVYAAITLDTERRRKEMAIRKVNGASLKQIMWLFARTYMGIGGVTALLAFPLLYGVMGYWKQMYSIFFHYGVGFWISVLLFVSLVTALTIAFRIIRIAKVNPAEEIKSE